MNSKDLLQASIRYTKFTSDITLRFREMIVD